MARKKKNKYDYLLKQSLIVLGAILVLYLILRAFGVQIIFAKGGFDDFGYNYTARIFNGELDGADRTLDGTYWGDPTYANDKLVMKWSKGWDDARFNGGTWGPDAWIDNEYNGKVPNGSGEVWHYKIVWVGPELETSPYWREGGEAIWGQFEVIMSQGVADGHFWEIHASPNGYGVYK